MKNNIQRYALCVLLGLWSMAVVQAQALLPRPDLDIVEQSAIHAVARQPDGGVIVAGNFTVIEHAPRGGIARLLPDGTLDPAWSAEPIQGTVTALAVDGSGAVYVANQTDGIDRPRWLLTKLDATNGSTAWTVVSQGVIMTLAADGADLFAGGLFHDVGGFGRAGLAKLATQDGAVDADWAPMLGGFASSLAVVGQVVYVGGQFSTVNATAHANFARFARDGGGAFDAGWNPSPDDAVVAMAADGAGSLYLARSSSSRHGSLARLSLATGQIATDWQPVFDLSVRVLAIDSGALYAGGEFTTVDGTPRRGSARFSRVTGALDPEWTAALASGVVGGIAVGTDGRVTLGGPIGQNAPPQAALRAFDGAGGALVSVRAMRPAGVRAFARLRDGSLMLGGTFEQIDGHDRLRLARLHANGELDTNWRADADGEVARLVANADGEVYVGGTFTTIAGQPRAAIARFAADGAVDAQWNPAPTRDGAERARIATLALGDDETIYAGGQFDRIGGQARNGLAKLAAAGEGAADAAWNPNPQQSLHGIGAVAVDGAHVYVAGGFRTVGGLPLRFLARVAATGAGDADGAWNPSPNSSVSAIAVRGGSVYVSGSFSTIGGLPRGMLAKLSGDGSADANWGPLTGSMHSIDDLAIDGAGNIHAVGNRLVVDEGPRVPTYWKVRRDGVRDMSWGPGFVGEGIRAVWLDAGAIYVGGNLTAVDAQRRYGLAAFGNDVIFADGFD